jgi:vanillate monooxygenase ferredoxin subunit
MSESWIEARVASVAPAATDIVVLELVDRAGRDLPPFTPGAHIDVEIERGVIRQYSLCNSAAERHRYQIGVLKEPQSRGGSVAVHRWKAGDLVRISAPRNHFPLHAAPHSLLFAGGIGITPILCMAEQLAREKRGFTLHYCVRSLDRAAFLDRIATSPFAEQVALHVDDGDAAQKLDLAAAIAATPGAHVYVCGPAGFIDFVLAGARAAGIPDTALHVEYFAAPEATPPAGGNQPFQIRIASTAQLFDVGANESIIDVLERAGIDLPVSCCEGICGTCVVRVLEGEPDHRDLILTDKERTVEHQFTPCCSRARGKLLVLDL